MELLKRATYSIYKIYLLLLFATTVIPFFPFFFFFTRNSQFKKAHSLIKVWGSIAFPLAGVSIKIEGTENFPNHPYVICPNHSSYVDILVSYMVFPGYFIFMGKAELKTWPIFNLFFNSGMNILVDRNNKMGSARAFLNASKAIDRGESVVIFPEATIPWYAPKMKEFKDGAFVLALKKGVPIVPISFLTNHKILKSGGFFKSHALPGPSKVVVHPPVYTNTLSAKDLVPLRKQCFDIIDAPLKPFYEN